MRQTQNRPTSFFGFPRKTKRGPSATGLLMESRSLKYLANACGGVLRHAAPEVMVERICTDSRHVARGDLFVALAGERFDAHNFLPEVAEKGAAAVVAEKARLPRDFSKCGVIAVESTRQSLGEIAARYRADFDLPVIAVGGSNGKTTTKELLAAVLRVRGPVVWSEASFNNDVGVPLTLLKIERSHRAAVIEVGTNHPGEMAPLLQIARPRFGVLTSIGREHLEFFGDLAGVAQEEGFLAELLPADGVFFVNCETPSVESIVRRTRASVRRVGLAPGNDFQADKIRVEKDGVSFHVTARRKEFSGDFRIHLLGRHQVTNALLALAVGAELGMSRADIQAGFDQCRPVRMRLQLSESNGLRLLDDTYNANADSMQAALQTLHDIPCEGRRIAVLGDMAELGVEARAAHVEIGRRTAELGINFLFAIGKMARETVEAAKGAGLGQATAFDDAITAGEAIRKTARPGDLILIKASRAARLERVGEMLRSETQT